MQPNEEDNIVSIPVPKQDPKSPKDKDTTQVPQRQTSDEQPVVRVSLLKPSFSTLFLTFSDTLFRTGAGRRIVGRRPGVEGRSGTGCHKVAGVQCRAVQPIVGAFVKLDSYKHFHLACCYQTSQILEA